MAVLHRQHAGREQHARAGAHLRVVRREQQVLRRPHGHLVGCPPTRRGRPPSRAVPCAADGRTSCGRERVVRSGALPGPSPTPAGRRASAPIAPRRSSERDPLGPVWAVTSSSLVDCSIACTPTSTTVDAPPVSAAHRPDLASEDGKDLEGRDEGRVRGVRGVGELRLARRSWPAPCRGSARPGRAALRGLEPVEALAGRGAGLHDLDHRHGGDPDDHDDEHPDHDPPDRDPSAGGGSGAANRAARARPTSPGIGTGPPRASRRARGRA